MLLRICLFLPIIAVFLTSGPSSAEIAAEPPYILLAQSKSSTPSQSPQAEMDRLQKQAEDLSQKGEHGEAREAYKKLYELQVRHQGSENQATLDTRFSIAQSLAESGENGEAEKIYRELLEVRKRLSGSASPESRLVLDKLALALFRQGKYGEAKTAYQQVYQLELEADGEDGQAHSWTGVNLANTYMKLKEYDEDNQLYEKVLAAKERLLSPEDQALLETRVFYGVALYQQGQYGPAKELFIKNYQDRKKSWGGAVPLNDGYNLANTLLKLNEWESYDKLCDEIFDFWEKNSAEIHDSFFDTYQQLWVQQNRAGQPARFLSFVTRLESLARKALKKDDPRLSRLSRDLMAAQAAQLKEEKKYAEALVPSH